MLYPIYFRQQTDATSAIRLP